ncbi:MAG: LysR family transcriptional regulator, partial [Acidobacteria bacterium]|nr:LysR family transcriptional regulator [Acidobacteriota bacterium]
MDLFQLQTFIAVVQEGSFSRAAQKLHRSQPAISQTIRKLEEEINEPLLDRSSRDGTLTDAGQVMYEYAQKLLNLRTEAHGALTELRELHSGKLSIAANEFTSLYLLPLLDEFRRLYPTVKITVLRSLASRIPDDLLNHNAELGVVSFRPNSPDLQSISVYSDRLSFIVHRKHPLSGLSRVKIQQLGAEVFIAHNVQSPYRLKVIEAFRKSKTPLNMTVELPTIESIKKFVAMGNGVALLPRIAVQEEL